MTNYYCFTLLRDLRVIDLSLGNNNNHGWKQHTHNTSKIMRVLLKKEWGLKLSRETEEVGMEKSVISEQGLSPKQKSKIVQKLPGKFRNRDKQKQLVNFR